ncbi:MAG: hypothetical protein AAFZ87_20110 [Planctomycetota bacterium]
MGLADRLDAIRRAFQDVDLPEHHRAALDRNIVALEESGAVDGALGVGAAAPDVAFAGEAGPVRLADLAARGPVVLTWFRGRW